MGTVTRQQRNQAIQARLPPTSIIGGNFCDENEDEEDEERGRRALSLTSTNESRTISKGNQDKNWNNCAQEIEVLAGRKARNRYTVSMDDFELLRVLGTGAYGKVFLVRKLNGHDRGKLYAMKVLRKAIVAQKTKTLDHTRAERKVLESIRNEPFLVTMHYAFQTNTTLHLILDYVNGGELFTHLYQRDHFREQDVKIYIGELILALEKLHKVRSGDHCSILKILNLSKTY